MHPIDSSSDANAVAEKIRASLAQPFELLGHHLRIGASIGIALYPRHGIDPVELTRRADDAMYQAKQQGSNCWRLAE